MPRLLDPTLDVVFKLLFAHEQNRRLLISLLEAVLDPSEPIVEVEVLNPELDKETIQDKGIVLDVRVRLSGGRLVNVEMQSHSHRAVRARALYYWARLYGGQLRRGESYEALAGAVSLFILDFSELETRRYHSVFRLLEVHEHAAFCDDLVLHVLELPKLVSWIEAEGEPLARGERLLARWGRFLKAETEKDLEALAMTDPIFDEAKNALLRLSSDPKAQELAEERRIGAYFFELGRRLDREHDRAEALAEGLAEGRAEGRTEGRTEGERRLLEKQLALKFGPLSASTVERLRGASEAELGGWAERILTATTLATVFEAPASDL